jgi:hypothetical protein
MVGAFVLIQTHVNGATERTHGLTGIFRDLIVTRVFCAERFLLAARLDWLHRYWPRAARPAPAKRVQMFNDRASLFVGIPQIIQFAL